MDRRDCDKMFIAVLETGSFSRGAERLGTSAGQASKMVSRLEADLGVRLLHRTTRALAPTEAGLAYFERIRVLIDEFEALDASIRHASGRATGRLRLSVPISFGTLQMAPLLNEFAAAYPDIQLDVSFSDRLVQLVDEGFDAIIRVGQPSDTSLIARRLCDVRIVLAASPAYLERRGSPATPQELSAHDCIIDTNFREPFLWRFRNGSTVAVKGRLRFSNAEACLGAAEAGLGIARVPTFMAGPRFRQGTVRPLLQDWEDRPFGAHIMYPAARHLPLKTRLMVEFLANRFRGEPEWDQGWP
ncbi:LysR substrate binding domain protein [Acetobacteraceae bacterium AT-5844]|nr:LysR substrate binding domain protein [Acetobacteraceae bacterium AT-5844]